MLSGKPALAGGLRAVTVAWALCAVAVAAAWIWLFVLGFTHTPVDVDEGYGLSIVRHLAAGEGFQSDAIGNDGRSGVFDPRASTGALLLLPAAGLHAAGVDIVIAGRIVGTFFALVLVSAAVAFGWRFAGRWGALAAAAAPLALDTFTNGQSPLQSPAEMLGEFAVAGLVLWAALMVRKRPLLAAGLVGVAVTAKVITIVMIPGIVLLFIAGKPIKQAMRRLPLLAALAALPTFAFEIAALIARGLEGDRHRLGQYLLLFHEERSASPEVPAKLNTLAESWFLPKYLAAVLILGVLALIVWALRKTRSAPGATSGESPYTRPYVWGWLALIVLPVLMWITSKTTSSAWVRHPSPSLLIGAIWLAVAAVWAVRSVENAALRVAAAVVAVAMCATQAVTHVQEASRDQRYGTLSQQRELADVVADRVGDRFQTGWGIGMSLAVMEDLDVVDPDLYDDDTELVVVDTNEEALGPLWVEDSQKRWCGASEALTYITICEPR